MLKWEIPFTVKGSIDMKQKTTILPRKPSLFSLPKVPKGLIDIPKGDNEKPTLIPPAKKGKHESQQ